MSTVMDDLWSARFRFTMWWEVEVLAVEAVDPGRGVALRRMTYPPTPEQVAYRERTTDHDVAAFVDCLQAQLSGSDLAGWIHRGLTSSDVTDTVLHYTVAESLRVISDLLDSTSQDYHRIEGARWACRVGKIAGAVGAYGNLDPAVEEYVCAALDLEPVPGTQVISRDRIAEAIFALALVSGDSRWVCPALEDVSLWHERDISHSSVERIMLPHAFASAYAALTDKQAVR